MLTHDFQIKIVDLGFGIPMSGKDGSSFMTTKKGTPGYVAPEIIQNLAY